MLAISIIAASCSGTEPAELAQTTEPAAESAESTSTSAPTATEPTSTESTTTTTTTTTSTTTSTTTTTAAPLPASAVVVDTLGSIRSVPTTAEGGPGNADATEPTPLDNDATIYSLGCTRSTGCDPTDLAIWAANLADAVNLATRDAAIDGADVLSEHQAALLQGGVTSFGFGVNLTEALRPAITGGVDRPTAFFGLSVASDLTPDLIATDLNPGIVAGAEAITLLGEEIEASQEEGFHTIVVVDFGDPEARAPSQTDLELAQTVVNLGADAVVGHGSDFLQRFERLGETTVAFGLGNAVTTTDQALRSDTAVFRVIFADADPVSCLLPGVGSPTGVIIDDPSNLDC